MASTNLPPPHKEKEVEEMRGDEVRERSRMRVDYDKGTLLSVISPDSIFNAAWRAGFSLNIGLAIVIVLLP